MPEMKSAAEILANLPKFTGTKYWYVHPGFPYRYTDGVEYLAKSTRAYWLIDLIFSWQHNILMEQPFQVWTLSVNLADQSAEIVVTDGKENEIARQALPFTDFLLNDFPLNTVTLWWNDGILMLPSEH